MKRIGRVFTLLAVAMLCGCKDEAKEEKKQGLEINYPGGSVRVGEDGVQVDAPNVKVDVNKDKVGVKARNVDVEVEKK